MINLIRLNANIILLSYINYFKQGMDMNNQINQYQQRLFNKLFATLPSVRKAIDFNKEFNFDVKINHFYCFKNKDFWFTRGKKEGKYFFLFGIKDKPLKDIRGNDACLIIDFDSNIQFNDICLGLFSIKNGEIHILINYNLLKKRYPHINIFDLKLSNIKSFDNSLELDVIDLGDLNNDFIDNLEKLIKAASLIKTKNKSPQSKNKEANIQNVKKDSDECHICSKNKSDFKINSKLTNLKNIKPELCGKCIEKIVVSEFFTKISPLLKGNNSKELKIVKEKFGNDELFDIGLTLLEKYGIIKFIGVKRLLYVIDRNSYLIKKFIKYSDENNLLIDNIFQVNKPKRENNQINDEIEEDTVGDDSKKDESKQMEIVIQAISNGKSRKKAAELANIPRYKILHWYNDGIQGNDPETTFFYRRLNEIEGANKKLNNKMNLVLNMLKTGQHVSQIDFVNENEINVWIEKGKQNKMPYADFYDEYKAITEKQIKEYEIKEINRKIFLENFKSGKTKEESSKNADIDLSLLCQWYAKGRENIEPYVEFYNKCVFAKDDGKPKIPKLVKTDIFGNKNTITQMNDILEYMAMGKSEDEAIRFANVSKNTYKYWMNRGKQEFGKLYIQFYYYVNQIKYETYDEEELWENVPENKVIDPDIYAPLPEEYEKAFISSPMNQSGIAWVNKIGNKWIYTKQVNGKTKKFDDEDIYELHRKVKNNNHVWGIRDYDKARKIIDIPVDFEVPSKPQIEKEKVNEPTDIDPDIYAPLPEEYMSQFNQKQANKTGIAWVNQYGLKWIYSRTINGEKINIQDFDIYKLHQKVKKNNLTWGIKDYDKARKIIDIPKDFIAPETREEPIQLSSDILAPLPKKYLSSFNPNQKNKTGIAWVNKIGNKWVYQRRVNGLDVKFSDEDIHDLHDTIINNNQIWGIIDFDKANPIIESNQIKESEAQITTKPINPSNVVVNYIDKPMNEVDIIIKGLIRNNDLIKILSRLKLFEKNIKRIITTSIDNKVDIFIELEINKYLKNTFEEKIDDFGWNINK